MVNWFWKKKKEEEKPPTFEEFSNFSSEDRNKAMEDEGIEAKPPTYNQFVSMRESERKTQAVEKENRMFDTATRKKDRLDREARDNAPITPRPVDAVEHDEKQKGFRGIGDVLTYALHKGAEGVGGGVKLLGQQMQQDQPRKDSINKYNPQAYLTGQAPAIRKFVGKELEGVGAGVENLEQDTLAYWQDVGAKGGISKEAIEEYERPFYSEGKLDLSNAPARFLMKSTGMFSQMAPGMLGGTPGTMIYMGLMEKESAMEEWTKILADKQGVSPEELPDEVLQKTNRLSTIYGIVSGILESLVPSRMFGNKIAPAKIFKRAIAKRLSKVGKGATQEVVTEVTQGATSDLLAYSGEIKDPNLKEFFHARVSEAVETTASFGIFGGGIFVSPLEQTEADQRITEEGKPAPPDPPPPDKEDGQKKIGQITATVMDIAKGQKTDKSILSNMTKEEAEATDQVFNDTIAENPQLQEAVEGYKAILKEEYEKKEPVKKEVKPKAKEDKSAEEFIKKESIFPEAGTRNQYYTKNPYRNKLDVIKEKLKKKEPLNISDREIIKKGNIWELEQVLKDKPAYLDDGLGNKFLSDFAKKHNLLFKDRVVAKNQKALDKVISAIDNT